MRQILVVFAAAMAMSALAARPSLDAMAGEQELSRTGRALMGANSYKNGDVVPLWASKVGPFSNPRFA